MWVPTRKRVGEVGAVQVPQKIITSHHFILGGPHPRRGRTHKNNRGGFAPAFLSCPSSLRCGAGEDETKGGVDFMGQSAPGPIQLVVNHFDHSSNNWYSSKTLPFWIKHHRFVMNEVFNKHVKNWVDIKLFICSKNTVAQIPLAQIPPSQSLIPKCSRLQRIHRR